jgi:hypothetical protein
LVGVLFGVLAAMPLPATASAKVTEYPIPTAGSLPLGITTGEEFGNKIARIPVVPVTKDRCRDGGRRDYPQLKNQGQCVVFVNHK